MSAYTQRFKAMYAELQSADTMLSDELRASMMLTQAGLTEREIPSIIALASDEHGKVTCDRTQQALNRVYAQEESLPIAPAQVMVAHVDREWPRRQG